MECARISSVRTSGSSGAQPASAQPTSADRARRKSAKLGTSGRKALRYEDAMFPQIFGKYVLEREIAAGGMARVFLATLRGAEGFEKRLVVEANPPGARGRHGLRAALRRRSEDGGGAQSPEHRAGVRARSRTGRLLHRDGVLPWPHARGHLVRDGTARARRGRVPRRGGVPRARLRAPARVNRSPRRDAAERARRRRGRGPSHRFRYRCAGRSVERASARGVRFARAHAARAASRRGARPARRRVRRGDAARRGLDG